MTTPRQSKDVDSSQELEQARRDGYKAGYAQAVADYEVRIGAEGSDLVRISRDVSTDVANPPNLPTPSSLREQIKPLVESFARDAVAASKTARGFAYGNQIDQIMSLVTTYIEATDTSKVTRFEVIDHTKDSEMGRAVVKYGADVKLSFQDNNRTLKVFLTDQAKETVLEQRDD